MTERDNRVFRGLHDQTKLFGDKWVPAILVALLDGLLSRVEILSKHTVLHDSIPARMLKKMHAQGQIVRESRDKSFPSEVTHPLTPAAGGLLTLAEPMIERTRAHPELRSRGRTHSRHGGAETPILDDDVDLDSPARAG